MLLLLLATTLTVVRSHGLRTLLLLGLALTWVTLLVRVVILESRSVVVLETLVLARRTSVVALLGLIELWWVEAYVVLHVEVGALSFVVLILCGSRSTEIFIHPGNFLAWLVKSFK